MAPSFKRVKVFGLGRSKTTASQTAETPDLPADLESGSFLGGGGTTTAGGSPTGKSAASGDNNHGDNPYLDEYRAYVLPHCI